MTKSNWDLSKCKYCNTKLKTYKTRVAKGTGNIVRYRKCPICDVTFVTEECSREILDTVRNANKLLGH